MNSTTTTTASAAMGDATGTITATPPTVFVVDDDPAVLKAVTRLLRAEGFVTLSFPTAEAFLSQHDPSLPGCLVLDMMMPSINGLALQRALLDAGCERSIVFISGQGDVAASVQAMKGGAVDYLVKPFEDKDFLAAIRAAVAKDLAARVSEAQLHSIRQRITSLTPREREVLEHIIAGQLNKQIAADLGTVEKTIKVHRARVMEKMGASSLAELVRLSLLAGLGTEIPMLGESNESVDAELPVRGLDQSPISPRSHIESDGHRV
jgi:two-component system, LuxR family, response regulator FixJ